jgi:hypothetical protein
MLLSSMDGSSLRLSVERYQYPDIVGDGSGRNWDANWLVIRGEVTDARRTWGFADPCLTTSEARSVAAWLRGVASGVVPVVDYDGDDKSTLEVFTEPNIALNLAARDGDQATVRVYLSLETQPPWGRREGGQSGVFNYYVRLTVRLAEAAVAAQEWAQELDSYPVR